MPLFTVINYNPSIGKWRLRSVHSESMTILVLYGDCFSNFDLRMACSVLYSYSLSSGPLSTDLVSSPKLSPVVELT